MEPEEEAAGNRKQSHVSHSSEKKKVTEEERGVILATNLCKRLPSGPPASGSGW